MSGFDLFCIKCSRFILTASYYTPLLCEDCSVGGTLTVADVIAGRGPTNKPAAAGNQSGGNFAASCPPAPPADAAPDCVAEAKAWMRDNESRAVDAVAYGCLRALVAEVERLKEHEQWLAAGRAERADVAARTAPERDAP